MTLRTPVSESTPEAASKIQHGGHLVLALDLEESRIPAASAACKLPSKCSKQASIWRRVPQHLQSGQTLPRVQGIGHCLENSGEPGKPGRKGRFLPLLGEVRRPESHWPGMELRGGLPVVWRGLELKACRGAGVTFGVPGIVRTW